MIRKAIFLGANSRGVLSGVSYLWRKCPGSIIQEQLSREQLCVGGGGAGNFPRRQLSSGAIVRGPIIRGAIFHGGNYPRGQVSGGQ